MLFVESDCSVKPKIGIGRKTIVKFVISRCSFSIYIVSQICQFEVRLLLVKLSRSVRSPFVGQFVYVVG